MPAWWALRGAGSVTDRSCSLQRLDGMKEAGELVKLTRSMNRTIVHHEGATSLKAASHYINNCASTIKLGVDVHARLYVVVAQYVQRKVTKHGNPRLRAALVECAWCLVRFQPQYPPVKKRRRLLAKGARATGAQRKKAIVAVARHLAVDLWRLHTGQTSAEKLKLRM
jgi:Transposase IS116/IS110/IS902 family